MLSCYINADFILSLNILSMLVVTLLFSTLIALIFSYTFLMTIFKKEPDIRLLTKEAALTCVFSAATLIEFLMYFGAEPKALQIVSVLFLVLAICGSLFQTIVLRREVPQLVTVRFVGILSFSSILFFNFLLLAILSLA